MTTVRRSSRQRSITNYFTPHFNESGSQESPPEPDIEIQPATSSSSGSVIIIESGKGKANKRPTKSNKNTEAVEKKPRAAKRKIPSPTVDVETDESFEVFELNDDSAKDPDFQPTKKAKLQHERSMKKAKREDQPTKKAKQGDQENEPISANLNTGKGKKGKEPAKPKKVAAPKQKPTKKKDATPAGPKKRRTKFETVSDKLKALGVKKNKRHGNCARAAIYKGHIKLTGDKSDLDQVVFSGNLPECGHNCSATLRDLLEQPDYAGMDYEDGQQEAVVFCDEEESKGGNCDTGRTYVTQICSGKPEFDSGKFHNHCNVCKNFGKCIGDYREAHCKKCGKHYFAGNSGFKCGCKQRRGGFGGYRRRAGDCSIM